MLANSLQMSLNIKLLLDTRRAKQDGSYPLVMRILYNRKSVNISMGYSLHEKEWNAQTEKVKPSAQLGENITRLNNLLHKERTKAYDIVTKLQDSGEIKSMSLKGIKAQIVGQSSTSSPVQSTNVFVFIDDLIRDLKQAKKQGNAYVYKTLRNKLSAFVTNRPLTFDQINYSFLQKLETSHYAGGGDVGGLSVYMRTLRAIYNKAIKAGVASIERYPFNDYKIRNKKPVHKAMSDHEFNELINYRPESNTPLYRDKNLFMASFYLRGMNWMDMAHAKVKDISGDFERLNYVRRKTGEPFSIKIQPKLKEIILEFLGNNPSPGDYIFPIIPNEQPEAKHAMTIRNKRQRLNKRLKEIAQAINISPFTIYTARHTYATMAKRKGIPTAVIQESLGHATESMTQTYLDGFENTVVDEYDKLIMGD